MDTGQCLGNLKSLGQEYFNCNYTEKDTDDLLSLLHDNSITKKAHLGLLLMYDKFFTTELKFQGLVINLSSMVKNLSYISNNHR